jgi:hypothetical protein
MKTFIIITISFPRNCNGYGFRYNSTTRVIHSLRKYLHIYIYISLAHSELLKQEYKCHLIKHTYELAF